jgi:hypothetical protein
MSQQTVDINVFKGLISTADPKDIPYEQASDCANIDFSSIAGGIQGLQLDVLDYRSATPINRGMSVLQPLFPTDPTYTQDRYFFGVRKVGVSLGQNKWEVWVYDQETQEVFKSTVPVEYLYDYPTSSAGSQLDAQADSYITSSVILKTGGTNIISSVGNTYRGSINRTVPSEVLYINHKQFQATTSQDTTIDWRDPVDVSGTPKNNYVGELKLNTTAAPSATADMENLYWLELDRISLTDSTPVADGLAPSNSDSPNPGDESLAGCLLNNKVIAGATNSDVFAQGAYYYYYTAEIMYQTESLPSRIRTAGNPISAIVAPSNGYDAVYIQLALYSDNNFITAGDTIDPRVTAINLYRVYTAAAVDDPDIYPKVFITRISIEELQTANAAVAVGASSSTVSFDPVPSGTPSPYRQKQFYHVDTTSHLITSPTYEDRTGIPSTLDRHLLYYGLSADANSYHFVARPEVITGLDSVSSQKEVIENSATIVLRSQRNRPRLFDWSTDFFSLPFAVNGMASYNGKLFVFGTRNMAIVDPETLGIDDVFNDIGILHNDMQLVIKTGLYWCDARSVYRFNGAQIERIGFPIEHDELSGLYQGWQTAAELFDPTTNVRNSTGTDWSNFYGGHMMYDGEHNAVIVHLSTFFENSPPGYREWMFFIDSNDWCRVTAFDSSRSELEASKRTSSTGTWILDSDIPISTNGAIYKIGAGASRTGFQWSSKELGFGSGDSFGNRKATYRYQVHGTGGVTLDVSEDNAAYANVALSAGGTPEIKVGNRSGSGVTYFFRQMKMRITGAADAIVTAVSIRLRGLER